ncbi:MAG: hypothetical protein Q8J74_03135 [Candidatus Didemnitutus sp.]|nr:hypothetical protein [Candidatus Didemnitutus sp.]
MIPKFSPRWLAICLAALPLTSLMAWDYEGHRAANRIALAALPADFPDFVREPATAERIAWLSSEADRWRSAPDLPARHCNAPDHYLDLEFFEMAGLEATKVSSFRYEYAVQYAQGRAAHPENYPPIDPAQNADRTRELSGFLPWTIAEYFGKLRGNFARLKVLEELGSPEEMAQAQASIVEMMGVMGHFVGDGAQPLHTTIHHNGWVGANPQGYTTWRGFHSWIDSGFIRSAKLDLGRLTARATPAQTLALEPRSDGRDPMFQHAMDYLAAQFSLVEPLYQLEQAGKFKADRAPPDAEAVAFIEGQVLVAGQMLANIWLTAWRSAAPDNFLRGQVIRQKAEMAQPTGN